MYSIIQKRNTAPPFSTVNSLNGALYPKMGSPVYVTLTETPESEWRYSIKQVFRMGKSDNPRYIPVVKVQLCAAREVQAVVKNGHKLKHLKPGVYVRESRPKWVRDSEHNFRTLARSGEGFTWRNGRLFPSTKSTNNTTE